MKKPEIKIKLCWFKKKKEPKYLQMKHMISPINKKKPEGSATSLKMKQTNFIFVRNSNFVNQSSSAFKGLLMRISFKA